MIRPAGWYWMNCERSKQATARALGSLDVSKIVMRTLKICNKRSYISFLEDHILVPLKLGFFFFLQKVNGIQ